MLSWRYLLVMANRNGNKIDAISFIMSELPISTADVRVTMIAINEQKMVTQMVTQKEQFLLPYSPATSVNGRE